MDNLNASSSQEGNTLGQMCIIMCPPMIDVFNDIYTEAHTISKGKEASYDVPEVAKRCPIGLTPCPSRIRITLLTVVLGLVIF